MRLLSPWHSYRRHELTNYLRYTADPDHWLGAANAKALWLVHRLLGPRRLRLPWTIPAPEGSALRPCFRDLKKLATGGAATPLTLTLATQTMSPGALIDWEKSFPDPEDTFALHRFGWLLVDLETSFTVPKALQLWDAVLGWLHRLDPKETGPAWETYTVSERVVHWSMLYCLLAQSGEAVPEESLFAESLRAHLVFIARRLEFHGEKTNNHLTNNGRALYIGGQCAAEPGFVDLGRRIVQDEHSRIFTPGGFLRESSSHYHFLLLRTYLELYLAAGAGEDRPFKAWLEPAIYRMLGAARFLWPEGDSLPLIGDVSPDFPPAWFKDLFTGSPEPDGPTWRRLWKSLPEPVASRALAPFKGLTSFADEGWYRFDQATYRIFWHVEAGGVIPYTSHGHHDTGAFELHCEGRPVLVDTGRASYEENPNGYFGMSAAAHNAFLIDGFEPFVSDKLNALPLFDWDYAKAEVEVRAEDRPGGQVLDIAHDGFGRLPGVTKVHRQFVMKEGSILLTDHFSGEGEHSVETYFHPHPDCRVAESGASYAITWPGGKGKLLLSAKSASAKGELSQGTFSPRYGEVLKSRTIKFTQKAAFPLENIYEIEFEHA